MAENETNPSKVQVNEVRALTEEVRLLKEANAALIKENEEVKVTAQKMAEIEDARLASELGQTIKAIANYSDEEIAGMSTEQMLDIKQILMRNKASANAAYKTIRAGNAAADNTANLTVGSLYGKTREEILKAGGQP